MADVRPQTPLSFNDLLDRRTELADEVFERYDFAPDRIEAFNGWETCTPGVEMTRVIFLLNREDPELDSFKGHFTVCFSSPTGTEISDVYAIVNGQEIGHLPNADASEPSGPAG